MIFVETASFYLSFALLEDRKISKHLVKMYALMY